MVIFDNKLVFSKEKPNIDSDYNQHFIGQH